MKITVKAIVYTLTDAFGDVTHAVVGNHCDNICLGGIGIDGAYHQYNCYEGRHAYKWAEARGMKVGCYEKDIEIEVN